MVVSEVNVKSKKDKLVKSEKFILLETVSAVAKHGSIAEAAKQLNLPRKTVSDRYHRAVKDGLASDDLEIKVNKVKIEKQKSDLRIKDLEKLLTEKETQLSDVLQLNDAIRKSHPDKIKIKTDHSKSESTAIMVLSDVHLEESIDPKSVEGMNEYNLSIAERRTKKFFENGLKLIEMCRSTTVIDNLVLGVLGDLIDGKIHDDSEENNLSPTEASLKAYELLVAGIDFLVENGHFKKILVPCCYGNHSRTTNKSRIATSAKNNFEWMIYNFLASKYKNHPIVQISITDGYFHYVTIYDKVVRFHHGDYIRYGGGVGGLHIPLRKAIAQFNKFKRADIDIMGHYHTRTSGADYLVNGSIVGYNAFAISIKADYERPQQSFMLIHSRYGKTVEAPILVE